MSKQQQFIDAIAPDAQEVQRKYGVPASIVIAQAALESGWGERLAGNNMFGVKAGRSWAGATINATTHEYINGIRQKLVQTFRNYTSIGESLDDYGKMLASNPRYTNVLNAGNAMQAADELQRAGYATDIDYAEKLKSIISSNDLTRLDDKKYMGYTEGKRFEETKRHFDDQRKNDPSVWEGFLKGFKKIIEEIFSGLSALLFGGDQQTASAPLPTPTRTASANPPVRGA